MWLLFWLTRSNLTLHKFSSSWELHLTILFRNKMVELHKDITSCICQDIFKRKKIYISTHTHRFMSPMVHLLSYIRNTSNISSMKTPLPLMSYHYGGGISITPYIWEEGRKERQSQHRNQPWLVTVSFPL